MIGGGIDLKPQAHIVQKNTRIAHDHAPAKTRAEGLRQGDDIALAIRSGQISGKAIAVGRWNTGPKHIGDRLTRRPLAHHAGRMLPIDTSQLRRRIVRIEQFI